MLTMPPRLRRLMLTPSTAPSRSILSTVRALPSLLCPSSLLLPTLLHAALPPSVSGGLPLLVRAHIGIDPVTAPAAHGAAGFAASVAELAVRLPVETALRRGQWHFATGASRGAAGRRHTLSSSSISGRLRGPPPPAKSSSQRAADAVVPVGAYTGGLAGTLWHIVRDEGERRPPSASATAGATSASGSASAPASRSSTKGQGLPGLWRGWRVGWWGLVGVWGAAALGPGAGGEF